VTTPAPFFADVAEAPKGAKPFWVHTEDGMRIRTVQWTGGRRGTAFLFSGRSEYVEKYGRVAARLVGRGFSVVGFDWRGQGLSTRPAPDPTLGHVADFRDYQKDWTSVRRAAEAAGLPLPYLMVAHSMGGCIGLRTLGEGSGFAAALMSAPMWSLHMAAATRQVTASLGQIANLAGFGARRLPGALRQPSALALEFPGNTLSSCPDHFAWWGRQLRAHPELGLAGPSLRWTQAAFEEMARLYVAPLPRIPVLTFLGTEERVVSAEAIRIQMNKMPAGELVTLQDARHEIWMERPEILDQAWSAIDDFLARVLPGSGNGRARAAPNG
jgi:lysophospholipase